MKRHIRIFVAAAAAVLLPLAALADGAEVVAVLATGYGVDPDAAKKAAGRAAIEQVVGQLVDAETLVENDELVKDRILTYSGAFLEDLDVVGAPSQADGLWTVKVLAKVRKTQLAQKLRAENVGTVALKKGKLFAQAASRAQEAEDAAAMVKAAFEGFPKNVVRFNVCKNDDGTPAISVVDADGNVAVDVELGIDPAVWKEWARNLISKLEKVAVKTDDATWEVCDPGTATMFGAYGNRISRRAGPAFLWRWGKGDWSIGHEYQDLRVAVVPSIRPGASGFAAREFEVSGNNVKAVRDVLWRSFSWKVELTVALMADDEQLESRTLVLYTTPGVAIRNSGSSSDYCYPTYSDYCILPAFSGFGWWSSRTGSVGFFPAATISLSFGKLSSEVLANATDIRTSVRFFVPGPSVTTNMDVEVSEHKKLFPLED